MLKKCSLVLFGLFVLSFLFLPTHTGQTLLTRYLPGSEKWTSAFSLLFLTAAAIWWGLAKVIEFRPSLPPETLGARRAFRPRPLLTIFQLGMSGLILALAWNNVRLPLEWDESSVASLFPDAHFAEIVNPFRAPEQHTQNTNQSIATLLSYLSYKAFGMHKVALRLPSLCLLVIVLGVLFYLVRSFSPATIVLVYAHLACNPLFLWYSQVAKGYISMIAAATGLLLILFGAENQRFSKVLFGSLLVVTLFTHPFGALFVVVLFLALLVWLTTYQAELSSVRHQHYTTLLLLSLAAMPLVALVCGFQFYSMRERAEVSLAVPLSYLEVWSGLLGTNKLWWAKILAIVGAAILGVRTLESRKMPRDFQTFFIAVAFIFFLIVSLILGVAAPYPRVMLAFLIPLLIWLTESTVRIESSSIRYTLLGSLALLLVVAPLLHARQVKDSIYANYIPFENFVDRAREATASTPRHCLTFHGIGAERRFAETVYFPQNPSTRGEICQKFFHLLLAAEHDIRDKAPDFFLRGVRLADLESVFNDGQGRMVYRQRGESSPLFSNLP